VLGTGNEKSPIQVAAVVVDGASARDSPQYGESHFLRVEGRRDLGPRILIAANHAAWIVRVEEEEAFDGRWALE
jgi:hypothetical protein